LLLESTPDKARDAANGSPLANPATPAGALSSATRRDGAIFPHGCVTRRLFGMTKLLSSRLAMRKNGRRRMRDLSKGETHYS
jgi:hypothetical protein